MQKIGLNRLSSPNVFIGDPVLILRHGFPIKTFGNDSTGAFGSDSTGAFGSDSIVAFRNDGIGVFGNDGIGACL